MGKDLRIMPRKMFEECICTDKIDNQINKLNQKLTSNDAAGAEEAVKRLLLTLVIDTVLWSNASRTVRTYPSELNAPFAAPIYQDFHAEGSSTVLVRPFIEWLYLNEYDKFLELVNKFKSSHLFSALIAGLEGTDLKVLFAWNQATQVNLENSIAELKKHGESLRGKEVKNNIKNDALIGDQVVSHAEKLGILLNTGSPASAIMEKSQGAYTKDDKKKVLLFKLEFLNQLHEKDTEFKKDKNYHDIIRFIANFAAILFPPLLVYNIYYRLTERKWLFFDKTTAQDNTRKIQDNLTSFNLRPVKYA